VGFSFVKPSQRTVGFAKLALGLRSGAHPTTIIFNYTRMQQKNFYNHPIFIHSME